jgi:tetratricopeptide (TPR) repeat protein
MADASAYSILGLQKGATEEEIKKAFVELVKRYDPERHTERFIVIQNAYNKLRNVEQRAREDIQTYNIIRWEFLYQPEEQAGTEPPPPADIESARNAWRANPSDPGTREAYTRLLLRRARVFAARKQWPDAIRDWEEAVQVEPTNLRARQNLVGGLISLGTSYALHNLHEEALELWERAVVLNPDLPSLFHNLALLSMKMSNSQRAARYWAETVKHWQRLMETSTGDTGMYWKHCLTEAYREYGELIEYGQREVTRGTSSTMVSKMPATGPIGAGQPSPVPAGPQPQAPSSAAGGPPPGAFHPRPSSTGASAPDAPPPPPSERRVPMPKAVGEPPAIPTGTGGLSAGRFRKILELNPDDDEARFGLVRALMDDSNWAEAIKELAELQRRHPKNTEVLDLQGWALLNSGQVDQAFAAWQRALTLDPKNARVRESLVRARLSVGKQLRERGMFTHALVQFKSLMRLLPTSNEVRLEIAATYEMKGDVKSAELEYKAVLEQDPKNKVARKALTDLKIKGR